MMLGGDDGDTGKRVRVGLLGADFDTPPGSAHHRISHVIPGHNWQSSSAERSPLATPGCGIDDGNYLISIDGVEVSSQDNIHSFLEDKVGRAVTIGASSTSSNQNVFTCTVEPIRSELVLRRREWVENNRAAVAEASGGTIGGEGIAKAAREADLTQAGMVLGTPSYISPELLQGAKPDRRADIWAVAVILYEVLSGRRPFEAKTIASLIHKIIHEPLPPLDAQKLGLSEPLVAVVTRIGAGYLNEEDDEAGISHLLEHMILQGTAAQCLHGRVDAGTIAIDGQDIRQVTQDSIRKQLGIVLQDTFLFSGTVMDNIRYGRLDASDDAVYAAARLANADWFIRRLPKGYQTQLGKWMQQTLVLRLGRDASGRPLFEAIRDRVGITASILLQGLADHFSGVNTTGG